ncbi:D-alanyl-D-alanine carboxypeptidase [Microseira wollei]|uniref:Peptidase S13, D-Ala-D-Ala carboxypeptidase C n=1 Tax=Microseira wollei NIES-4236 TaxID=2530354 RepID=A0AAV3WFA5_9CYAN|nr:D-alanyl-D-alanine carboxypeptidase [Microseira wollei]GET36384.1 peptidase S13, D-Ala-D-Ala carboxypeptidase C [Microseira wollei NIES-4236]
MLELFSSGVMSVWLDMAGLHRSKLDADQRLSWLDTPGFVVPAQPEPATTATLGQYFKDLASKGPSGGQAVWMQSGPVLLANKQGTTPKPAASLTKIATTLAALAIWHPSHQFETLVSTTGPIKNGVLQGDLVVSGRGNPVFLWEEAIALGNALNRMGIRRVTGNLIVSGNFAINYAPTLAESGQLLKLGLHAKTWPRSASLAHRSMAPGTPKPLLQIAGNVIVAPEPTRTQLLLRHRSLPLSQILKIVNVYSDNKLSQKIADLVGGHQVVANNAAAIAGFPRGEIQLINGSGLGVENRISPRAACAMLVAIQRKLQPYGLNIGDVFPVSGSDLTGTMVHRQIPTATAIKTGTLRDVSALAGVMPTRDRGLVWFTIINRGGDIIGLRAEQDRFLQKLVQQWGATPPPTTIVPHPSSVNVRSHLGDAKRIEIVFGG